MSDIKSVSTAASEATTKEQDEDDWKKMENIRVVCRFRPINTREMLEEKNNDMRDSPPVIEYGKVIKLGRSDYTHAGPMEFVMDRVFENNTTQNQVFVKVGKPMVMACLEGYNSTIFAYGQTGSGKTFTMFGPEKISNPELLGIAQRSVSLMFEDLKRRKDSKEVKEYQVLAEFIQLYREQIKDLLEPDTPAPLKIRLDIATDSPYIPNLRQVDVSNTGDVVRLLTVAQNNRINAVSSRSHMVMTMRVIQTMKDGSADLAGSESYEKGVGGRKGTADPKTIAELKAINLSLTNLTRAINYLSKGRKASYRSSQLTFLLMDSLGGNSKTTLIIACSPHILNRRETIRTLEFGKTAKAVKNKAKMNKEDSKEQLMNMVKKLQRENKNFKGQIALLKTCLTAHGIEIATLDGKQRRRGKSAHRGGHMKSPTDITAAHLHGRPPLLISNSVNNIAVGHTIPATLSTTTKTTTNLGISNINPQLAIPENEDSVSFPAQTRNQAQEKKERKRSLDMETGLDMLQMQSQRKNSNEKPNLEQRHCEMLSMGGISSISIDSTSSIQRAESDKMTEELKDLQDELSKQESEVSQLRYELQAKADEIETLTDELRQASLVTEDIDTLKKNKEYLDNQLESMAGKLHEKQEEIENEKTRFENIIQGLIEEKNDQASVIDELQDRINDLELFNSQLTEANDDLSLAMSNQQHKHKSQLSETIKDKNKMENVASKASEILSKFFMIQIKNEKLAEKQLSKTESDLAKLEMNMKKTIDDYYEAVDTVRRKTSLGDCGGKRKDKSGLLQLRPRTARPGTARNRKGKKSAAFGDFDTNNSNNNNTGNSGSNFNFNVRPTGGSVTEDSVDSPTAGDRGWLTRLTFGDSIVSLTAGSPVSVAGAAISTPRVLQTNLVYEMQTVTKCLNTAVRKLKEQRESHSKEVKQIIDKKDKAIDKLKSKNMELLNEREDMENDHEEKMGELEEELLELREKMNELENDLENIEKENKELKKQSRRAFVSDGCNSSNDENNALIAQIVYLENMTQTGFEKEYTSTYQAQEKKNSQAAPLGPSQVAPWRRDLQVGSKVDCMDDACLWWTSEVMECDGDDPDRLKIGYDGFDERWDDWVARGSTRLAPYKTRALGGRERHGTLRIEVVATRGGKAVFKQGWLSKQGGHFKTYKTRYFVLHGDGTMHYFKQMTDKKPIGGFNIKDMTETRRVEMPNKGLYEFEVATPKRDWRFQCDSERSVTDWVSVIHAVSSGKLENMDTSSHPPTVAFDHASFTKKRKKQNSIASMRMDGLDEDGFGVVSEDSGDDDDDVKTNGKLREKVSPKHKLQRINEDNSMFACMTNSDNSKNPYPLQSEASPAFGSQNANECVMNEADLKANENENKKKKKDENVDYEGWMYKQGKWQANWTLRYCKLLRDDGKLQSFTDRDGKLIHEVDLNKVSSISDVKHTKHNRERLAAMEIPTIYAFQMVTPGTTYTFACKSEIELNLWMKHARQKIEKYAKLKHKQAINNGNKGAKSVNNVFDEKDNANNEEEQNGDSGSVDGSGARRTPPQKQSGFISFDDSSLMTMSNLKKLNLGNGPLDNDLTVLAAISSNSKNRAKLKEMRRKSVPVLLAGES